MKKLLCAAAMAAAAALAGSADAAQTVSVYAWYLIDQPFITVSNATPMSFSDVELKSVGGLFPGETLDFGPMGPAGGPTGGTASFFADATGAFSGDYDDFYTKETSYQLVLTGGGQTYLSNIFSPSQNLSGGYVDFLGLGADVDIAPALVAQAAVPEPATWALLTLGVGLIGLSLRARRGPAPARARA